MSDETIETISNDDPEAAAPALSETEMLDWYTKRIHSIIQEEIEVGSRPLTDKALVLGVLIGAKALCRIQSVLERSNLLESGVVKIFDQALAEQQKNVKAYMELLRNSDNFEP